jgi:hypothetical protein
VSFSKTEFDVLHAIDIDFSKHSLGFDFEPTLPRLAPLKKVNIFVGPNNSGKSRLMRGILARLIERSYVPFSEHSAAFWQVFRRSLDLVGPIPDEQVPRTDLGKLSIILHSLQLPTLSENKRMEVSDKIDHLISRLPEDEVGLELRALKLALTEVFRTSPTSQSVLRLLYVPTVRGFRTPPNQPNYSSERAKSDYFGAISGSGFDVSCGGDMYQLLKNRLLGNKSERKSVADFERFLSENFFEGRPLTLIPHEKEQQIYVTLAPEKEQRISNVGDGLQHLISILFPVFMERKATIQAVEEPELFLHPGFQTKLLECYLKEELAHVQLLATTHSNHLVNFTLDREKISIFRVKKIINDRTEDQEPKFRTCYVELSTRDALSELGVQRASLLLSNCVIFVEGPTDRAYFQKYIELCAISRKLRKPIADLHYSFLEYGGVNLASYSFLEKENKVDAFRLVGSDFLVIIDSDISEAKKERANALKNVLGTQLITFDALEVENLLSPKVLSDVITSYEKRIVTELNGLTWSHYQHHRLGTFIEKLLGTSATRNKKSKHPYADFRLLASGEESPDGYTLRDKANFARKAISFMQKPNDLSDEALRVGGQLLDFIVKANPNVTFQDRN